MENEVFVTSISKVVLGEDGIGRVIFHPNAVVTLEAAKEHLAACAESSGDKRRPVLVHLRSVKSIDREARLYFAGEEASKVTKAGAIVVSLPVTRVAGSFFVGLTRPPFPVKPFTSKAEALEWLEGYLE